MGSFVPSSETAETSEDHLTDPRAATLERAGAARARAPAPRAPPPATHAEVTSRSKRRRAKASRRSRARTRSFPRARPFASRRSSSTPPISVADARDAGTVKRESARSLHPARAESAFVRETERERGVQRVPHRVPSAPAYAFGEACRNAATSPARCRARRPAPPRRRAPAPPPPSPRTRAARRRGHPAPSTGTPASTGPRREGRTTPRSDHRFFSFRLFRRRRVKAAAARNRRGDARRRPVRLRGGRARVRQQRRHYVCGGRALQRRVARRGENARCVLDAR